MEALSVDASFMLTTASVSSGVLSTVLSDAPVVNKFSHPMVANTGPVKQFVMPVETVGSVAGKGIVMEVTVDAPAAVLGAGVVPESAISVVPVL